MLMRYHVTIAIHAPQLELNHWAKYAAEHIQYNWCTIHAAKHRAIMQYGSYNITVNHSCFYITDRGFIHKWGQT